jgi:outer membrane lipoprotein
VRSQTIACALSLLLTAGCATVDGSRSGATLPGAQVPAPDAGRYASSADPQLGPSLADAMRDPKARQGEPVRWGGTVVRSATDARGNVEVEIDARGLDASGRPRPGATSEGRFLIRATPDVDPALYARGNQVTVEGRITGAAQLREPPDAAPVPLVHVEQFRLWQTRVYQAQGGYYDPWWDYGGPGYRRYGYGSGAHLGSGFGRGSGMRYGFGLGFGL